MSVLLPAAELQEAALVSRAAAGETEAVVRSSRRITNASTGSSARCCAIMQMPKMCFRKPI